jgi:prepilin-type N-terminal cleavage/methylation domain-containing protein
MLTRRQDGFTLIEVCIAIVILTVAILGLGSSTARMLSPVGNAELEFAALQAVEDRLSEMRLDPRYGLLDSIYGGTETGLPALTGMSRATTVTRTQNVLANGNTLDFQTIVVTVAGGNLPEPVSRTLIMGAP